MLEYECFVRPLEFLARGLAAVPHRAIVGQPAWQPGYEPQPGLPAGRPAQLTFQVLLATLMHDFVPGCRADGLIINDG